METHLKDRVILVTGATGGIGEAICQELSQAGATLAIHTHHRSAAAKKLASRSGNGSLPFSADLARAAECRLLFDRVIAAFGRLDALVNNAGIFEPAPVEDDDTAWMQAWDRTLAVNLTSSALLSKMSIAQFRRQGGGRIVFIASRAAFRGETADYLPYAASKGGMVSLSRSIARSFGKESITSFVIAPGFVRTAMAEAFIARAGEEAVLGEIALPKLTTPADVAPLVAFICSGRLDHCTGATFDVNAGSYMR